MRSVKVIGLLGSTFLMSRVRLQSRLVHRESPLPLFDLRVVPSPLKMGRPVPSLSMCRVPGVLLVLGLVVSIPLTLSDNGFLEATVVGVLARCVEIAIPVIPLFRVLPTVLKRLLPVPVALLVVPPLLLAVKLMLLVVMPPSLSE